MATYLALINLMLALFNLVPAFPMDGGRLLRGALWGPLGKARATRISSGAGTVFAFLLIFAGVFSLLRGDSLGGLWYILIGWFIKDASLSSYQQVRLDEALRGVTVRDAMVQAVATIPGSGSVAEAAREYFMRTGYGSYPVTRGDAVVGLLCLKDVLRLSAEEREATSVQGAMRPLTDAIVTDPDVPLPVAIARMAQAGTARLLVMHGEPTRGSPDDERSDPPPESAGGAGRIVRNGRSALPCRSILRCTGSAPDAPAVCDKRPQPFVCRVEPMAQRLLLYIIAGSHAQPAEAEEANMLWTIFVILVAMWLLGMVSSYTMGRSRPSPAGPGGHRVLVQRARGRRALN